MVRSTRWAFLMGALALVGLVSACGGGGSAPEADEAEASSATVVSAGPAETVPPATQALELNEQASATPGQQAEAVSQTPTLEHLLTPSEPAAMHSMVTDRSSRSLADEKRAVGDNYEVNLYERPFTAGEMAYRPYLDITRAELSANDPFVYVTIFLEEGPPSGVAVTYGVEIDEDLDGDGDWFIFADAPEDGNWTTDGASACRDSNDDVGGAQAMRVDASDPAGDGYEDCVFESGYGTVADAAWVRRNPDSADQIQIAFLGSLIGPAQKYLWGAWADEGVQDPSKYDLHDLFTLAEAGSPAIGSPDYPLKTLAMIDNTCRWGYGFTPTADTVGACYVQPAAAPTSKPSAVCVKPAPPSPDPCYVWFADQCQWVCIN